VGGHVGIPAVPFELRGGADLAERADSIGLGQGDEPAGLEIGVGVLQRRPDGQGSAASDREHHRRGDEILLLRHPVEEVGVHPGRLIAEPEEADQLDAGAAEEQRGPNSGVDPMKFAQELPAERVGAGRVPDAGGDP
jgi:hypothetical protein